ncbi:MAG: hypothetical protein R2865_07525 [Deinococcales bacterium]
MNRSRLTQPQSTKVSGLEIILNPNTNTTVLPKSKVIALNGLFAHAWNHHLKIWHTFLNLTNDRFHYGVDIAVSSTLLS